MPVTSTVYSEAILEAKRLREVAEANAKNALIEVVAPRVRQMIERQLLGESIDDLDEDILASVADDAAAKATEEPPASAPTGPEGTEATGDDEDKKVLKDALKGSDVVLTVEAAKALSVLSGEAALAERFAKLKKRVAFLREMQESSVKTKTPGSDKVVNDLIRKSLAEARTLEEMAIRIGKDPSGVDSAWASDLMGTRREIDEMAARKKTIRENAEEMLEVDIPGLDDPVAPGDEAGPPMEDEPLDMEDDASEDVQIPADLAQELLATLEAEMAGGEEVEDEDEVADEGSEDSEGDLDDDDMVDIDEGMLRRELARMRESSIREDKAPKKVSMIDPKASSFGGGKVEREVFVDSDDSDLNVMEAKHLRQELVKEGRKNRALRKQLTGLQTVMGKLREQLEQMNLFNAKLLYVNKLMTNEGVTTKQKQVIVESLDKAKTLREVKLLYKTLSTSLLRGKPKAREQVTESVAVRGGSASRPAQTGSTTVEAKDPQLDRWATLAGIKSKK